MTFREDDSRIRRGYGAENFSTLRHFALNLVKRHAPKLSVRKKRISAGFSDLFREELLATTGGLSAVALPERTLVSGGASGASQVAG